MNLVGSGAQDLSGPWPWDDEGRRIVAQALESQKGRVGYGLQVGWFALERNIYSL